jgi:hypothetical protein
MIVGFLNCLNEIKGIDVLAAVKFLACLGIYALLMVSPFAVGELLFPGSILSDSLLMTARINTGGLDNAISFLVDLIEIANRFGWQEIAPMVIALITSMTLVFTVGPVCYRKLFSVACPE